MWILFMRRKQGINLQIAEKIKCRSLLAMHVVVSFLIFGFN